MYINMADGPPAIAAILMIALASVFGSALSKVKILKSHLATRSTIHSDNSVSL